MTDKQLVLHWWKCLKHIGEGDRVNLSLIQRPKRVSAHSETLYIYAPSVLMEGNKLKPKTIIKILEVHEGPTPQETTLKVMDNSVWADHWYDRYGTGERCKINRARAGEYDAATERPKCICEGPIEDMDEAMKNATHFVLLSDIGK